jgi:hypothetical protein
MNRIAAILAVATLFSAGAIAQETAPGHQMKSFTFTQDESGKMPMNMMFQGHAPDSNIMVMGAEMASPGELVTGVPYTATEVTETTQTLSDGNRIVNKTSGTVARDSQGRVRREMSMGRIGPVDANNHKMIFISDPTAHRQEVMDPGGDLTTVIHTTGESANGPQIITLNGDNGTVLKKKFVVKTEKGSSSDENTQNEKKQVKHEDLGTQTIAGVSAQGKRDTITIPAGEIGNERPFEVVSETWYSPDLHITVMRKHSDPRVGETVFQLTDIQRTEPDPALFQVPDDVKVQQMHMKHAAPKE